MKEKIFDINFKIALIDNLLYTKGNQKPSFLEEYNNILNSNEYKNEADEIYNNMLYDSTCKSLYDYIKNLELTDEDLQKIEYLNIDAAAKIYIDLAPSWDGESKIFDITSIKGIERLTNLKEVEVFSLVENEVAKELMKINAEVWIDGLGSNKTDIIKIEEN